MAKDMSEMIAHTAEALERGPFIWMGVRASLSVSGVMGGIIERLNMLICVRGYGVWRYF